MASLSVTTDVRVRIVVAMLVGGAMLWGGSPIAASAFPSRPAVTGMDRPAQVDTSDHPNQEPYTTDRSLAYHVLATPAYLLHGVTRPIGWTMQYVERRFPAVFEGRLPPRGGVPLVEFGGPAEFMGGLLLYDNQLFGSDHALRIEGLYGSANSFRAKGQYQWPDPLGVGTRLDASVNLSSNPKSTFFLDGNDSDRSTDRANFFRRQVDASVNVSYRPRNGWVGGQLGVSYERVDADQAEGERGRRLVEYRPPGLQPVQLLTPQLTIGLARTNGEPRTSFGTELFLQLHYAHELDGRRFRHGRYVAEFRQYLPVLLFPKSRRLVLRGRLEQVEPLFGGEAVPFYQLPSLGGQRTLRGFRYNRFQNAGSLVLTAEYRYPIWSNLDAVAFVDAGQVFPELSAVDADRFHWSYGGGVHLLNASGLSFRFEMAGGVEGLRTILTVEPNFRRVTR